eukprot:6716338-Prymnesium_polylepis.1
MAVAAAATVVPADLLTRARELLDLHPGSEIISCTMEEISTVRKEVPLVVDASGVHFDFAAVEWRDERSCD